MDVNMNKTLMASCQASRTRYQTFLNGKKRVLQSETDAMKHKQVVAELDDLKADILELNKCADDFSTKAEVKQNFSMVAT